LIVAAQVLRVAAQGRHLATEPFFVFDDAGSQRAVGLSVPVAFASKKS
jgi:hypothetical protein